MSPLKILLCGMIPLLLITSCGEKMDVEKLKGELIETDRAFSELSKEKGSRFAFYTYLADDGYVLPGKGHPINKEEYGELLKNSVKTGNKSLLTWQPIFADIAESGEIGYTHGKYELITTDSTGNEVIKKGYYVSIWKKQPDGNWKFVFDAGNEL